MLKTRIAIAVAFILLSACSSQPQQSATDLTVEMLEFAYNPASMSIPVGKPVTLALKNTGNIEHDFVIDKIDVTTNVITDSGSEAHHAHGEEQNYDLHISAAAGETSVLEFTAWQPGTYKIFCSVEGHEAAGMIGELTVLDQD